MKTIYEIAKQDYLATREQDRQAAINREKEKSLVVYADNAFNWTSIKNLLKFTEGN